jgi:hypothetical protein
MKSFPLNKIFIESDDFSNGDNIFRIKCKVLFNRDDIKSSKNINKL